MTGRGDVDEELRARLHEAAGAHEPDRARILARVERGMAGQGRDRPGHFGATRPPSLGWARVAGATAAVAGVLAVGGYAVASALKDDAPPQRSVATSPTPAPSPEAATGRAPAPPAGPTPSAPPGTETPDAPASSRPPAATGSATARPPVSAVEDGPLWSDGSVDPHSHEFWAQSNITLKTGEPLTALTVELVVAQTGGVTSTGAWRSLQEEDFTFTVEERDGFLVHRWTLKQGRTVPAGEWMFAGQYDHERGDRDAGGDRYSATATAGSERLSVRGGFAPRDGGS
ncbi:hypothetical protein RI578_30040 [Streptomyces sp. BB1-1-1]|uniref:hypothetical protein n=1 Tax=Streptomyces sp. BB1-1-1 TaxID=3074430 RepID=UPI0028774AEF|nr:hypothetical protein [Streptomyces sp. BB1-1-1]WND38268.1 hypothetical protein RI578_30040 [Streptomyces sp. BB1-1-1]